MITENLSTLKIHKLTQTQYEKACAAGNIDENALYLTPDEGCGVPAYSTSNNGQFLRVINGVPTWSTIPNAEDATF